MITISSKLLSCKVELHGHGVVAPLLLALRNRSQRVFSLFLLRQLAFEIARQTYYLSHRPLTPTVLNKPEIRLIGDLLLEHTFLWLFP